MLITQSRVPDVPAPCTAPAVASCNDARNALIEERIGESNRLEDGLRTRSLVAGVGLALVGLMYAGFTVRREPDDPAAWAAAFRDVGTGTVAWIALGGIVLATERDDIVTMPAGTVLIPALVLLPTAAIGTFVARGRGAVPEPSPPGGSLEVLSRIGIGLAAATVLLMSLSLTVAGTRCDLDESGAGQVLLLLGIVAGGSAFVIGIASLLARRWAAALACIVVPPVAYIFTAAASGCLS